MKISIAMATYNGERFLRYQLASILAQQYPPDELVVCDDASTDDTFNILEAFRQKATFPVVISRNITTLGSTKNFERAIDKCSGDIVVLSDQDDKWDTNKLSTIVSTFENSPNCVAALSNANLIDADGVDLGRRLWKAIGFRQKSRDALERGKQPAIRTLIRKNYVTGAVFAFRRQYWPLLTPIPEQWVHDAWIGFLLASLGPIATIDESLVAYRQHSRNQIGIKKVSFSTRLIERELIIKAELNWRQMLTHVQNQSVFTTEWLMRLLWQKINHLERRILGGRKRRNYIFGVLIDLICGRYYKYSNGFLSFLKDSFNLLH